MVPVAGEGAKYWSRWRGPSGQGLVADGSYTDTWSTSENILWRKPVPGRGNSSPIVWREHILLTTAYDNGRRVSVLGFRQADGRQIWETFVPPGRSGSSHYKNGYASATPATDGERVYASFGARGLLAVDLNGAIVWQRDVGPMEAYHGTAGSPLVYRDRVILYQDSSRTRSSPRSTRAPGARCGGPAEAPTLDGARPSRFAPAITTRSS